MKRKPCKNRKPYIRLNKGIKSNNWYAWSDNNQIDWEGHLRDNVLTLKLDPIRRNDPNRIRQQLMAINVWK